MKKILLVTLTVILCATWSFAAEFVPTKMVITVPDDPIIYDFDGTDVDITFDLDGTPAAMWLIIDSKLAEAELPIAVRNGFLGWHYVNKIDTTVYISSRYTRDPGAGQTITWDGHSSDQSPNENFIGENVPGGQVEAGQYTYYLWGYDDKTPRELVSNFAKVGFEWECNFTRLYHLDEDGLPMTKPKIMGALAYAYCDNIEEEPWTKQGTHYKWEVGADPNDVQQLEWSHCSEYFGVEGGIGGLNYGAPIFDPSDYGIFYHTQISFDNAISTPLKWEFVPEGEAIKDPDWGNWDNVLWNANGSSSGTQTENMSTDGNYIYVASPAHVSAWVPQWDVLRVIDWDCEEIVDEKQMGTMFYRPDDPTVRGFYNGGFKGLWPHPDGGEKFLCYTEEFCLIYMADFTRLLDDQEDETDMVCWENNNGDIMLDNNWKPDAVDEPWACQFGTTVVRDEGITRHEQCSLDNYGFMYAGVSYHSLDSFAVMTPDGSPLSYCAFADDYGVDNSTEKLGGYLMNVGNAYDGIYHSGALGEGIKEHAIDYTTYVGYDNAKGIIADQITAVEDEEVAKFSIDQNSPNPFNPTTTVGFNLVEDGNVSIDIFNVAGQKVDTLVNDFMTSGKHSVVWDASGFSAGIYFYTVKSGDFSKTMKMTLLK